MALIDMSETYQMTNAGDHIDGTDVYQSNRNLLDNPWFTVNQRGISGTISGNYGYSFDRWQKRGNGTLTVNSDGSLTLDGTSAYSQMREPLEPSLCAFLVGHTVTLSVLFSDNTVFSATYNVTGATQYYTYMADGTSYISLDLREAQRTAFVLINGSSKTVKAMKLELGSVSTLASDVSPDYGTELLKCMRYFIRIKGDPIGSGYVTTGLNQAYIHIPTPVPMRTAPTASINGSMYIRGTGATWNVSTVTVPSTSLQPTNGVSVIAAVSATQVMAVGAYMSSANSYIDLTADL